MRAGALGGFRSGPRVDPATVVLAFVRRDWRVALSYRFGFASTLGQSLVSLVFLYFLGELVGSRGAALSGQLRSGYFPFAVLGTSLLAIVTTALSTVSDRMRSDQTTGTFETLLASPSPPWLTVASAAAYPVLYSTALSVVTVLIAVVGFGMRFDIRVESGLTALAGFVLMVALSCALGVGLASAVVVFKAGVPLVPLTATVFSLLGGVYYPIGLLPGPLRALSYLLPFTWALDVLRRGLLEAQAAGLELLWLALFVVGLVPASLLVFAAALDRARKKGTLGQY